MASQSDTIYELLLDSTDFDGDGFESTLERPPFRPTGSLTRFLFVDPDFDPQIATTLVRLETKVDGRAATTQTRTVAFAGDGRELRRKVWVRQVGRFLNLIYRFSSGPGTLANIVDESGNQIVDENTNNLVGPGTKTAQFRLLGHTLGHQDLSSVRR